MAALAVPAAVGTAVAGPVGGALAGAAAFGAQTRGDVYGRLKDRGIEPTTTQLAEATGLGALTGLGIEATGGLASKIPVSPLVAKVLGVGGEGAVFGTSGAVQEAGTQQAEIAGGKRTNYDPSAILSAGTSGVEMGVGFGVVGGLLHGKGENGKSRVPEGGVSAEPTRSEIEYRKPEAQVTAPVDINTPPENKVPPPPRQRLIQRKK